MSYQEYTPKKYQSLKSLIHSKVTSSLIPTKYGEFIPLVNFSRMKLTEREIPLFVGTLEFFRDKDIMCDFSYSNLVNLPLTDLDLRNSYLPFSDLRGTNFKGSDLSQSILDYSNMRGAVLIGTNVQSTTFNKILLKNAFLRGSNITKSQQASALYSQERFLDVLSDYHASSSHYNDR